MVLPIDNPVQSTPSNQPTGVQVSGQHAAVMPNTSYTPANPAPSGDNTRADDKPLPVSIREGKLRATPVKKNILKEKKTEADPTKGSIAESREKAKRKEEQNDNEPLVQPKVKAKAMAKVKEKVSAVEREKHGKLK